MNYCEVKLLNIYKIVVTYGGFKSVLYRDNELIHNIYEFVHKI